MAYRYDDEDQRMVGGGSAAVRAGSGARGSGFTNFSSLQQANQGFDRKLTDKVSTLNQETGAQLDKKTSEAQNLSWQPRQESAASIERLVNSGNQQAIGAGLNQSYGGPRNSAINLAGMQSYNDLNKLQDARNVGQMIADPSQSYSGGMRAFDTALFSGSGARGEALKGVQAANERDASANKIFGDKIAGFDAQAKIANSQFRKGLENYYDKIIGTLDKRVGDERAAEIAQGQAGAKTAGKNRLVFDGKLGTANRANQITQQEADALSLLSQFTGRDSITRDANYQRAGVKEVWDQALADHQKRLAADKAATGEVAKNREMLDDSQSERVEKSMKSTGQKGNAARARTQKAISTADRKQGRGY